MKIKTLAISMGAAFSLAACGQIDTGADNQTEITAEEQTAQRAQFDTETANNILSCTTGTKAESREMEPNYKGEFNQERLDWHKSKVERCVTTASGNFFAITYGDRDGELRGSIAQQIHNAEIAAYSANTAPEYPTAAQLSATLSAARK